MYCGIWIKCDMYWHVARFHLDVAQLWRCPVSWCTVWKVRRQVWTDSLKSQHSGISTDILLFSDIHLSLVHHYRMHKRGLPLGAFQKSYMSQLRTLLPVPVAQPVDGVLSPASIGPGSLRPAGSAEFCGKVAQDDPTC